MDDDGEDAAEADNDVWEGTTWCDTDVCDDAGDDRELEVNSPPSQSHTASAAEENTGAAAAATTSRDISAANMIMRTHDRKDENDRREAREDEAKPL